MPPQITLHLMRPYGARVERTIVVETPDDLNRFAEWFANGGRDCRIERIETGGELAFYLRPEVRAH